jgi:hypothetical protein
MAGRPGRNRAWNALSVEEHLKRGTFRKDRHGPQAGLQTWPGSEPLPPPWEPSIEELEELQPAGRTFLVRIVGEVKVDFVQGVLLLQAARILDDLKVWQTQAQTNPKAARLVIQYTRALTSVLAQTGIR